MRVETERKMRRWRDQRWLLDQVIQTRGLDWDQGRTGKILRNCGPGVQGDIQEISRRVQKFVDIPREFARVAGGAKIWLVRQSRPATLWMPASTTTSRRRFSLTPRGESTKTATRSASPGRSENEPATTSLFNMPAAPLNGLSFPMKANPSLLCCTCLRIGKQTRKFPVYFTFLVWMGSKRTIRCTTIRCWNEGSLCSP